MRGRGQYFGETCGRLGAGVLAPFLLEPYTGSPTIFFGTPLPDGIVADRDRHGLAYQNIVDQLGPHRRQQLCLTGPAIDPGQRGRTSRGAIRAPSFGAA